MNSLIHRTRKDQILTILRRGSIALFGGLLILSAYGSFAAFGIDLAQKAGAPPWLAALWPIVVTATIGQAAYLLGVLASQFSDLQVRRARVYLGSVLMVGVIISAAGNTYRVTHPGLPGPLPLIVSILIISVPTLCLPVSVFAYTVYADTLPIARRRLG